MKSLTRTNNKEYPCIDCMKVVMAIIVVAIHTSPQTNINNVLLKGFIPYLYNPAVPFFFTASGFLVWNKIYDSTKTEKINRLKGWIIKTFRLYIVWTAIYLPLTIYGFHLDNISITKSIFIFLRNTVFVGENYMSWPLWYLLGMLVAAVLIYIMVSLNTKVKAMYTFATVMALAGILLDYCHNNNILTAIVSPYFKLFLTTRNGFFQGLPYIMIGISIANEGVIKSKKWLTAIFVLSFIAHMFGYQLATFFMTYALFSLTIQFDLPERKDNLYRNCRLTSTIIYFVHMIFVACLTILLPIEIPNYILFLTVVILSFITARIAILYKDNRIVKFLFR